MVAADGQRAKWPYDLARPRTWPGTRVLVRPGAPTGATPQPPSSKYYTLRYLLTALLADGESTIADPARSDDTDVLVAALGALGALVAWRDEPPALWVRG
ncbi:MAG TPA: hypothetical protein VGR57_05395, partial [Ktedonobacterales bacterium]|nr:hypothetical protein [Ktedonobacterales bacterium]